MAVNIPGLTGYNPSLPAQQLNVAPQTINLQQAYSSGGLKPIGGSVLGVQTQAPQPQAPSGGGGGSPAPTAPSNSHINPSTGLWDDNYYAQQQKANPQGVSEEDINNAYNPVFADIQGLRDTAQANQQTYMDAATNPFEALRPDIEQAYTSGQNLNQQQTNTNNSTTQNALASARQLYNELSQGVQQRFGGAGSTSDFAKAFYGRQLQQNEGGIYNTAGQNQQSLQTQAANLLSQHDNNIKQLEAQKASALSNAQLQFQNMLQQIDQLKTQTDQQKAQAKLDAVTQLKATANAINQQFTQFGQQMQLQTQSSLDQLRNGVATAQAYSGQPVNLSSLQPLLASQIGTPGQGSYNPYNVSGQIAPTNKNQFGNPA